MVQIGDRGDCAADVAARGFAADRAQIIRILAALGIGRTDPLLEDFRTFVLNSLRTEAQLRASIGEAFELERQRRAERYVSRYLS